MSKRGAIPWLVIMAGAALLAGCTAAPWSEEEQAPPEASGEAPDSYTVRRGDTLYVIAWRYGLDYRELAAWNRLRSPNRIYAGQRLRLTPPTAINRTLPPPRLLGRSEPDSAPPRLLGRSEPESEPPRLLGRSEPELPPDGNLPAPLARPPFADSAPPSGVKRPAAAGRTSWIWPSDGKVVSVFQPNTLGGKGIGITGEVGQPVLAASTGHVVYSGSGLPGYGRLIIVKHSDTLLSAYGYLGKIFVKEGDSVKSGQSIAAMGASNDNRPLLHFEIRRNGKPVNPLDFLPREGNGRIAGAEKQNKT